MGKRITALRWWLGLHNEPIENIYHEWNMNVDIVATYLEIDSVLDGRKP